MIYDRVGMSALAVCFPKTIRTNDYWREKYPELVSPNLTKRRRNRSTLDFEELDIWSQEVIPYLADPFRGNVERRVMGEGESSLALEYKVAKDVLKAAKLSPEDIDLIIVSSIFGEPGISGNGVKLAQKLGVSIPAWNLESTCSSALIALQNARALIATGEYNRILVVTSHLGCSSVDEKDTLSRSMGDGAGAFIVEKQTGNRGILGTKVVNTASTCDAYTQETIIDDRGISRLATRRGKNASMLALTAVDFVRTCCQEAVADAGMNLSEVNYFVFNTPTAWYARVCAKALDIDPDKVINLYPRYGNIGSVYPIANLYHAALERRIDPGDLVLVYSNGAGATAIAHVMRWGKVALGKIPASPLTVTPEQERVAKPKPDISTVEIATDKDRPQCSPQEILNAKPQQRWQLLENYLLQLLSDLLQLEPLELNTNQSLSHLIDSLIAIELKRRIEIDLKISLPIEQLFQNDRLEQLIDFMLVQLTLTNLTTPSLITEETSEQLEEFVL